MVANNAVVDAVARHIGAGVRTLRNGASLPPTPLRGEWRQGLRASPSVNGYVTYGDMVADLEAYGYEDVAVGKYCAFNTYLPHFDVPGVCVKMYPWKLLEMQGENRTFWVGSSACFESVLDVVNYNRKLLAEKIEIV